MLRVMIVEDAAIMRHTIKRVLQELDYEVVCEANNGFEAIENYKKYKPDIVTMDITMPGENGIRDGIDSLIKIKEFDPLANIIMLTSHGEQKQVVRAISHGAKGYILKPVNKEKIEESFSKLTII